MNANMNPDLYEAAAKGEIKPFKKIPKDELRSIVTHNMNTILHVYIASRTQNTEEESVSTVFVVWMLDMCPSLLLQANAKGNSPLHVAVKCGHLDVVNVIIEYAKKGIKEKKDVDSCDKTVRQMLGMTNDEKNTALHEAVRRRAFEIVKILIETDPHVRYYANASGQTPLYMAAARGSSNIVAAILENCPSAAHEGPNGKNALHAVVNNRMADTVDQNATGVIRQLLKKKKSLSRQGDQYGWTPLHYAAYLGDRIAATMLLESDESTACIVDKDRKMTALHLAASQGKRQVVEEIIRLCPECYDMVDGRRWNILHFAMVSMKSKDLKFLLDKYPFLINLINEEDMKGNTPLHVLATVRRGSSYQFVPLNDKGDYEALNNQNISVAYIIKNGYPAIENEIQELSKHVGKGGQYFKGVISVRGQDSVVRASHLAVAVLIIAVALAALMKYSIIKEIFVSLK